MKTARRFLDDESGMTLPLAMIMIVLMGVMGAGLLAFTNRDLNTVVEENRGQRAFEMADTGVQVAKRQLSWHCAEDADCQLYYDDTQETEIGLADNQWTPLNGGVTLEDLDGDGDLTDYAHVTIDYRYGTNDYLINSEGNYGVAKRKIEAIIKGVSVNNIGTGDAGHPIYYTPSAVTIEVDETDPARVRGITLNDISMFSEKDILIEAIDTPGEFVDEYGTGGDKTLKISGNDAEELGNWNSMDTRYFTDPKPYNTTPRRQYTVRNNGRVDTSDFITPGYAAEQEICGFTQTVDPPGSCESVPGSQSIADGRSSYDSTTGTFAPDGVTPNPTPRPVVPAQAQKCTFMEKPFPANNQCYITYPFPRPEPPPARLKRAAQEANTQTDRHYWDVATEGTPDWGALFPGCNNPNGNCLNRLVFVDAGAADAPLEYVNTGRQQGVLVVWCGDLQLNHTFKGVIFNLWGDGSDFGATDCTEDGVPEIDGVDEGPATNGVFRNNGQHCQCWLYAQGGDDTRAGIEIAPDSTIQFLPGVEWSFKEFLEDVVNDDPPTQFEVRSWRELYE